MFRKDPNHPEALPIWRCKKCGTPYNILLKDGDTVKVVCAKEGCHEQQLKFPIKKRAASREGAVKAPVDQAG